MHGHTLSTDAHPHDVKVFAMEPAKKQKNKQKHSHKEKSLQLLNSVLQVQFSHASSEYMRVKKKGK